ncbi:MAG TPA: maltose ABC transporter permease MalF [Pseudomonas sp.]|nr:maltose ABC transporter permease MalF [Pseudomonas sp.]
MPSPLDLLLNRLTTLLPSELKPNELRHLLTPGRHPLLLCQRRATLIVNRVRLFAFLFAVLTPLWSLIDLMVFEPRLWLALAGLRMMACLAFTGLLLFYRPSGNLLDAYRAIAILFAIPTIFYIASHTLLGSYQLAQFSAVVGAGYAFLPFVLMAGLTIFPLTLVENLVLASLLQWELVRGKAFYRLMLILPYAVPGFISILVFRGLFNQNFGEINLLLEGLFGIRPDWFSDPTLARTMILIVNTWLGYPYMLLLCMGLLQAIPRDQYEASAIDGASPLDNLLRITLPQLIKPLMPLLIACFAFNFNNFVLITLLTRGGPDIIGATTPAGTTDLLVSYTYRIAFQDSGQDFALAAAIATMIFILVGAMALLNLKLSKVKV